MTACDFNIRLHQMRSGDVRQDDPRSISNVGSSNHVSSSHPEGDTGGFSRVEKVFPKWKK
jgi:hypothetical protein